MTQKAHDVAPAPSAPPSPTPAIYGQLKEQAGRVIVGQEPVFELLCVALFAQGHVLLEGVPGTAKTLMAKLVARLVDVGFRRIQFTPDLMPSDVVGTSVYDASKADFFLKRGPIFTNILLADEVNRAPAKTQSALLEAMEERQVTIEGSKETLDFPFMVLATQNPVEYEGTYPLPEAQLDRFLFKVTVPYPVRAAEEELLRRYQHGFDARDLDSSGVQAVLNPDALREAHDAIEQIAIDGSVISYVLDIVEATRASKELILGASPRASIALMLAARTLAFLRGRNYVLPDDIKELAIPVLRHRLIVRTEVEIEGESADSVITRLLARVQVPR